MIDRDEVRRIARLAHLEYGRGSSEQLMDDDTLDRLANDMTQMLAYVAQLEEVDVSNVAPTSHGVDLKPRMRDDVVEAGAVDPERLLDQSPSRAENAISVPKIVE